MDLAPFIEDKTLIPLGEMRGGSSFHSIAIDSRNVEKGGLFIAIPGSTQDGTVFIKDALERGATSILVSEGQGAKILQLFQERFPDMSLFETKNIRKATSLLAHYFYPEQPKNVVAVTGTNGKTSVASFTRQIWAHMGLPAASMGSLGILVENAAPSLNAAFTGLNTPDAITLHKTLEKLKKADIDHLVFEASSHGLHQHRLDSVHLKAAVFTNFSNEHLDYHNTMQAYFDAKCRLFKEVMHQETCAVLNTDIPEFAHLKALCEEQKRKLISFGKTGDINLVSILPKEESQDIFLSIDGKSYNFNLPLVGEFQAYNVLAAISSVIACGGGAASAVDACVNLKGVPGRLELAGPGIYVDYSHKPEALALALKTLRPHTKNKLCVVFGCGGNRDTVKRPMMGEIAARLADRVIITDDNPRYENPADIRQHILEKCPEAIEIPSRQQAIQTAIHEMQPGDVVLIAGKGNETYQLVEDKVIPFNDVAEVHKCLKP